MKRISTKQVGDGKLPNRYWVSISNDFYYDNNHSLTWVSERDKFKVKSKVLEVFNTYTQALKFFENTDTGSLIDGIEVNSKFIEDRLTGQLLEEAMREKTVFIFDRWEDTRFTEKVLKRKGLLFI